MVDNNWKELQDRLQERKIEEAKRIWAVTQSRSNKKAPKEKTEMDSLIESAGFRIIGYE